MPDVSTFWENTKRIMKLAQKPTRSEMWMQIKISFLGLVVIGIVGFIIRLIFSVITSTFPSTS